VNLFVALTRWNGSTLRRQSGLTSILISLPTYRFVTAGGGTVPPLPAVPPCPPTLVSHQPRPCPNCCCRSSVPSLPCSASLTAPPTEATCPASTCRGRSAQLPTRSPTSTPSAGLKMSAGLFVIAHQVGQFAQVVQHHRYAPAVVQFTQDRQAFLVQNTCLLLIAMIAHCGPPMFASTAAILKRSPNSVDLQALCIDSRSSGVIPDLGHQVALVVQGLRQGTATPITWLTCWLSSKAALAAP